MQSIIDFLTEKRIYVFLTLGILILIIIIVFVILNLSSNKQNADSSLDTSAKNPKTNLDLGKKHKSRTNR
ncbi:MAG: hypothetical protein KatS3mg090_0872 [Patescibacteria group bacterium]|nr:MAG: hypothetical protein KatS3mg090_0872 [Patescibacteria group bacterium]